MRARVHVVSVSAVCAVNGHVVLRAQSEKLQYLHVIHAVTPVNHNRYK